VSLYSLKRSQKVGGGQISKNKKHKEEVEKYFGCTTIVYTAAAFTIWCSRWSGTDGSPTG